MSYRLSRVFATTAAKWQWCKELSVVTSTTMPCTEGGPLLQSEQWWPEQLSWAAVSFLQQPQKQSMACGGSCHPRSHNNSSCSELVDDGLAAGLQWQIDLWLAAPTCDPPPEACISPCLNTGLALTSLLKSNKPLAVSYPVAARRNVTCGK